METWDLLDAQRRPTGETILRGADLPQGRYHLVVDVWIKNANGKYLISRRAPNKTKPGMWETSSGSVLAGEDSLTAALREAHEEVGAKLTPGAGRIILGDRSVRPGFRAFFDIWQFDETIGDIPPVCQAEEVSEARWASRAEILRMIEEGVFISHLGPGLAELQ